MKTKIIITIAAVALASFTVGHVVAQVDVKLNEQTLANLSTAMHGEALTSSSPWCNGPDFGVAGGIG